MKISLQVDVPELRDALRPATPKALKWSVGIPLAILLGSFPVAMAAVFAFDGDRRFWADFLAVGYLIGVYGIVKAPWLPWSGMKNRSAMDKLETTVTMWWWIVYIVAVTWELPYLLFTDIIRNAPDAWWAYTWWAYIDGGDFRYAGYDPTIVTLEWFTVLHGIGGLVALRFWYASGRSSVGALLYLMLSAAWHFNQTMQYYVVEAIQGFPSVGKTAFDLYGRFILVNSPWVIMPVAVWIFGVQKIRARLRNV